MHLHLRLANSCLLEFVESLRRWQEILQWLVRSLLYSIRFSRNVLHQDLLHCQRNYMDLHQFGQVRPALVGQSVPPDPR